MDNITSAFKQLERNRSDLLPRKFEAHKPCSDIHKLKLHASG